MLTPRLLEAQVPTVVSTSVSFDQRGNAVVTTQSNGALTHHPSRVLVRFQDSSINVDLISVYAVATPVP